MSLDRLLGRRRGRRIRDCISVFGMAWHREHGHLKFNF